MIEKPPVVTENGSKGRNTPDDRRRETTLAGKATPVNDPSIPFGWYPGHEVLLTDIVRAENCHLFDADGKRYVDMESGVWCTSIGHGHPRVLRALNDQYARIAHTGFGYTNGVVGEAAGDILSLLGFDGGMCVFLCSGSEAVEYGIRTARATIDRPLMMTMTDSYFGAYGSASQQTENEWVSFDWQACGACDREGECDHRCDRWAGIPHDHIGGFLFEPGSSSGLVRFPPKKLIRRIAALVRDNGGLVMVNEVTTGIGRTGRWFGYQHYDVSPDIVAMGKGIGNGYPVSVAAFAPRVIDLLGGRPVRYAQSHQNDPLGAAVCREVIRIIAEEGLIDRGIGIGADLACGLDAVKRRTGRIKEIRCRGLMAAIEMTDGPDTAATIRTHREMVRRGYILGRRPGVPVLRIDPSLTIDREDILGFIETFEAVLADFSASTASGDAAAMPGRGGSWR
jgi:acetylornithine aminotransferase